MCQATGMLQTATAITAMCPRLLGTATFRLVYSRPRPLLQAGSAMFRRMRTGSRRRFPRLSEIENAKGRGKGKGTETGNVWLQQTVNAKGTGNVSVKEKENAGAPPIHLRPLQRSTGATRRMTRGRGNRSGAPSTAGQSMTIVTGATPFLRRLPLRRRMIGNVASALVFRGPRRRRVRLRANGRRSMLGIEIERGGTVDGKRGGPHPCPLAPLTISRRTMCSIHSRCTHRRTRTLRIPSASVLLRPPRCTLRRLRLRTPRRVTECVRAASVRRAVLV